MREVSSQVRDEGRSNVHRMYSLLEETKSAVSYLYQLNPNPASVDPLYVYAMDALERVVSELDRLDGCPPSALPHHRGYRHSHKRPRLLTPQ
jgi:hypothetical protein